APVASTVARCRKVRGDLPTSGVGLVRFSRARLLAGRPEPWLRRGGGAAPSRAPGAHGSPWQRPTPPRPPGWRVACFRSPSEQTEPMLAQPKPQPLVIPVRYVAAGEVVQTTSTSISLDDVHVRSVRPPKRGLCIGLQLYLPAGGVLSRGAVVADSSGEEFRAEFNDADALARQRLSEVLWRREASLRPCRRFHTRLKAVVRERGRPNAEGYVSNLSRSGAFIRLAAPPARGSVVELEVTLPDDRVHAVHAYVVHVAERRGIGVQF